MVTWRHASPLYKHWYRLTTVEPRLRSLKRGLVISRFFSIHDTVTGAENIVRYTEDFIISSFAISRFHCTKEKENRPHPSPQVLTFNLCQFAHSHPFESRIIPTPSLPPILSLAKTHSDPLQRLVKTSNSRCISLQTRPWTFPYFVLRFIFFCGLITDFFLLILRPTARLLAVLRPTVNLIEVNTGHVMIL